MALLGIALAAPRAQASEWKTESGTALAGESFGVTSSAKTTFTAAGVTITCQTHTGAGTLTAGATAKELVVAFKKCSATSSCVVGSTLTTSKLKLQTAEGMGFTEVQVSAEGGKALLEITFAGSECPLLGKQAITGTKRYEKATPPSQYEIELLYLTNLSVCPSTLKMGANTVTFESSSRASLTGANLGKKWGIV